MKARAACTLLALLTLVGVVEVFAQDAVRGAVLMAAARQAIGGENRLKEVGTLQVVGTFRRVIDGNDTEGDFELFLEPPDKYLRSEKTGTPGQPSTETIEALVGTEVRDVVRGGGGGGRGVRGGGRGGDSSGGGGDDVGGGDASSPADSGDSVGGDRDSDASGNANTPGAGRGRGVFAIDPETQRRVRQADVSRLLAMWLGMTNAPVAWIGVAESPDGKADVLEARFADGQPTRLFLDIASHVPLMLQWQAAPARAGRGGRRGGQRGQGQGRENRPAAGDQQGGPAAPATFEMTFSDHRVVNGIRLPHVITKGMNGKTIEQWTIRSYRVNPSFNAQTFAR